MLTLFPIGVVVVLFTRRTGVRVYSNVYLRSGNVRTARQDIL